MARRTRAALTAALVCTLLAGCGDGGASGTAATPTPAATGEPWYDEITAAEAAGEAGGAGTPCPLPVTFPMPKSWKPKPIEAPDDEVAAEVFEALARRGGTTATCEVDGRRAGGGFLRVWIVDAPAAEPRAALEAFVGGTEDTVTDRQFREVKANGVGAVEATWVETSKLLEEDDRNWALALRAGDRTLVLATGEGLLAERTDVLPAYRLAMSGMRPAA